MHYRRKAIILFAVMVVFWLPASLMAGRAEAGGWPLAVMMICGSVAGLALLLLVYLGITTALSQLKGK